MQGMNLKRCLTMLPAGAALLLAACGGGDKNPTGPGQGGGEVDTWRMVALGNAGLPTDAEVEDCMLTRFYSGKLELRDDGAWRITLQVHDDSGDWGFQDMGEYGDNGDTGWFQSQISGVTYQATYDGNDLRIMYDWCANGVPDVQLVFE
jgi:hypothetical protein